ncbi:hypothetical protein GCM10027447_01800 [Glycomyces halotolerans]
MPYSRILIAGMCVLIVFTGAGSCEGEGGEETKTCEEWVSEYVDSENEARAEAILICNSDTDRLDPLTDEQLTRPEFEQRREEIRDELNRIFE